MNTWFSIEKILFKTLEFKPVNPKKKHKYIKEKIKDVETLLLKNL